MSTRSLRPPDTPNGNDPATVPPATVGPDVARPGDPNGVEITGGSVPRGIPPLRPQPWSGWPEGWDTPNWWSRLNVLTDTAWACLNLNSSLMGTMPPYLVGASTSLNTSWFANPSPDHYASWTEFAKGLFWDFMLGEAFVLATARYESGWPARFHVVPPWSVNAEMGADGKRHYRIGSMNVDADLLHIRYQSHVGDAHGHGPLEAGQARLTAAMVLTRYATNLAASGAIPNSVLTHPDELNATQAADLQASWLEARLSSIGLPAVLSGGVTFEALQFSPLDMGLIDLLQFNEARICVLLGVPPHAMGLPSGGDPMTYSNVSALFDYHWRSSLRPKVKIVMDALSQWLVPRGTYIELDRDEYVQPAMHERAQTYQIMNSITDDLGNPAMTVEEIRVAERLALPSPSPDLSNQGVLQ